MAGLRDREERTQRLDGAHAHLLPTEAFRAALEREPAYQRDLHTGITLMKTPELRVVLEVAGAGVVLDNPVVHGSATLHVLEGCVAVEAAGDHVVARAGEMIALPRDRERRICAREKSTFLLAIAPDAPRRGSDDDDLVAMVPVLPTS